jgi:hypothetical protein
MLYTESERIPVTASIGKVEDAPLLKRVNLTLSLILTMMMMLMLMKARLMIVPIFHPLPYVVLTFGDISWLDPSLRA